MVLWLIKIVSPLSYLVSSYFYLRYFINRGESDKTWAKITDTMAILLHGLLLILLSLHTGHLPLAEPFQALTTFMFFFATLNKLLIVNKKEYSLGVFHSFILFIFQLISMLFIEVHAPLPDILKNIFFEVHVIFNLVGYASFSSAFLTGIMYVLLFHEIKGRKLGYFYDRLPSLGYLEKLNFRAILIGFIFNTIGIVLGACTGKTAWGTYWAWDPKLIAVVIAWITYAMAIIGKINFHWKGKRLAYLSMIGFTWIIFSMLIINVYFSKIHSFN